jgi:hypothetical protein
MASISSIMFFNNFVDINQELNRLGLTSSYHAHTGEEFGAEPMGGAPMGGEEPTPQEPTENVFGESRVENVLKKYFVVTKEEAPILEEKKQKDYIKNKLTQIKVKQELQNLSETNRQLERANRLLSEGAQFVGKTNLDNLIFNKKGKQIKIDTRGNII